MKKFLLAVIVSLAALFTAVCGAGCNGGEGEHAFASDWTRNASGHWHACLNAGCAEKGDYAEHSFALASATTQPTCFTRGQGVYACTECGYTKSDYIPATGNHDFTGSPWYSDAEGHWRRCTTPGCGQEEAHSPHVLGEPEEVQVAGDYTDGITEQRCTECLNVVNTQRTPAKAVPTYFKVQLTLDRNGTWRGDDPEPTITWREQAQQNVLVGDVTLAHDEPQNPNPRQYRYSYTDGVNSYGAVKSIGDFAELNKAGVTRYRVDMYSGEETELDYQYTEITCFSGRLRVNIAEPACVTFRYRQYNSSQAEYETVFEVRLYINAVSYREYVNAQTAA